ncbi:MAG: UDP-glucose 4-epimerase, UDP-glucose 4-epimerase [Candidatus Peregrinibacteria bacterium GW2011_GWC2_39_14]|nr:MAG: UDP-glucose 4-epimerase [Candidatus Peregrinibacteria bacterium GW2011_GWA2_38_36]KKR04561.1 MAG: UDP-glucose 4-epimerase, UDP-glucose 4-epimerase [Candidatus Peregrinibacteria bacterium GW2011_GWC2_39_14]
MGRILVTGGAGYIGSHATRALVKAGYEVSILDDLSHGHEEFIPKAVKLFKFDICHPLDVDAAFAEKQFDAVMHFAGRLEAGLSMVHPNEFFYVNCVGGFNLLETMCRHGINKIIFSSSAAVYGEPKVLPIKEDSELKPINNYGVTKLIFEQMLEMYRKSHAISYVNLRYFNAAGADPEGGIGEKHNPETHLIPNIFKAAKGESDFKLFGTDYPTKDGTCVRDYIHVSDLADAHVLALNHLEKLVGDGADLTKSFGEVFNLGNGNGYSNKEVIDSVRRVTGKDFKVVEEGRREGDPPVLIADSSKAEKVLGWKQKFAKIDQIVETAWKFEISK